MAEYGPPIIILVIGAVILYFTIRKALKDEIEEQKGNNNHKR